MRVLTKICGLSTPQALGAAVAGGASHIGLVFYPSSPRDVALDQAASLALQVPDHVTIVGVFVDPEDEFLKRAVHVAKLGAIQLHGRETPERAAHLGRVSGAEIWKAVSIKTRADLAEAQRFRGAVQRIVYDAKTPSGTLPGGMGIRFDWKLLDGFAHPLPWFLSGGLDPANVTEALRVTNATAVDVSSGVERAPGAKDVDKITAFLQAVGRL